MIRAEDVRVWRCAVALLSVRRTPALLLVGVTYCSAAILRTNARSFIEWRALNECFVLMLHDG